MASQSSKGGTSTETEEVLASSTIGLFREQTDRTSKNPFTTMSTTLVMPPEVGTSHQETSPEQPEEGPSTFWPPQGHSPSRTLGIQLPQPVGLPVKPLGTYEGIFYSHRNHQENHKYQRDSPRLYHLHKEQHLLGDLYLHRQSHLQGDRLHPLLHQTLTEDICRCLHIREETRKRKGDDRIISRSDRIMNASSSNYSYSWNRTERFIPRILIESCSPSDFSPKEYPSTGQTYGCRNSRHELGAKEEPVPIKVSTTSW